jgi:hypothetical protein
MSARRGTQPEDRNALNESVGLSFAALCEKLAKGPGYVRALQSELELFVPARPERYSPAYAAFLERITCLRTFCVPMEDIVAAFIKEKKIMELLHADTLSCSPTWYLDHCALPANQTDRRLLLTGYDLGFPLSADAIQGHLDFGSRDAELFRRHEMGEDIRRVLGQYRRILSRIRERVEVERNVLERALIWMDEVGWA